MRYTVENEFLRVEVDSLGAELASVVDKASGAEMLWQGDPAVWPRRAPILFPYCGKLAGGSFTVEGKTYAGAQHGFARDLEHEFLGCDGTALRFRLASSAETLALFPFDFVLESTYALEGRTLRHTLAVTNTGTKELRFGIGSTCPLTTNTPPRTTNCASTRPRRPSCRKWRPATSPAAPIR